MVGLKNHAFGLGYPIEKLGGSQDFAGTKAWSDHLFRKKCDMLIPPGVAATAGGS